MLLSLGVPIAVLLVALLVLGLVSTDISLTLLLLIRRPVLAYNLDPRFPLIPLALVSQIRFRRSNSLSGPNVSTFSKSK